MWEPHRAGHWRGRLHSGPTRQGAAGTRALNPVVYDDLSSGHREAVRWGPLVEGDIRGRRGPARGDPPPRRSPRDPLRQPHRGRALQRSPRPVLRRRQCRRTPQPAQRLKDCGVGRLVFSSAPRSMGPPPTRSRRSARTCPRRRPATTAHQAGLRRDDRRLWRAFRLTGWRCVLNVRRHDPSGLIGEAPIPRPPDPAAIAARLGRGRPDGVRRRLRDPDGSCLRDYSRHRPGPRPMSPPWARASTPASFEAVKHRRRPRAAPVFQADRRRSGRDRGPARALSPGRTLAPRPAQPGGRPRTAAARLSRAGGARNLRAGHAWSPWTPRLARGPKFRRGDADRRLGQHAEPHEGVPRDRPPPARTDATDVDRAW
jgi:hypothetical protein